MVFDTNVLVSAFVAEGVCSKLLGGAQFERLSAEVSHRLQMFGGMVK